MTMAAKLLYTLFAVLYGILALQCLLEHWMSTATCAAALELPNLNYKRGTEQTLELKICCTQLSSMTFQTQTCAWHTSK